MPTRILLIGTAALLLSALPATAQQTPPLQYKMVDVNQAVKRFNANTLVQKPHTPTPTRMDFSRVFPKISLSPFPPRAVSPKLPTAFKVPGTSNPIQGRIPGFKGVSP